MLALGLLPEFAEQFSIVNFEDEFRAILVKVLLADAGLAYILDRCLLFIFGEGRLRTKY